MLHTKGAGSGVSQAELDALRVQLNQKQTELNATTSKLNAVIENGAEKRSGSYTIDANINQAYTSMNKNWIQDDYLSLQTDISVEKVKEIVYRATTPHILIVYQPYHSGSGTTGGFKITQQRSNSDIYVAQIYWNYGSTDAVHFFDLKQNDIIKVGTFGTAQSSGSMTLPVKYRIAK